MNRPTILLAAALMASTLALAHAQIFGDGGPDLALTADSRKAVIDGAVKRLIAGYVFPETAKKMEADIRAREAKGQYREIQSAKALAAKLTADLRSVSHDKHLSVFYSSDPVPANPEEHSAAERKQRERYGQIMNHGFEKLERLPGNVGYVKFNGFATPEEGAATVNAAMAFLGDTDALIFDVRQNGGGSAEMVTYICSYLFPSEPLHLNDIYFREGDRTQQFWTLSALPGKRYLDKPVYVLTSNYTFSAAEEFSYNLKTQKRATIVGETTGGGAHPVSFQQVTEHFGIGVPFARSINPVTHTNWEGTGVKPDIDVPAPEALRAAHADALKKLIARTDDTDWKGRLQKALENVEK